MTAAALVAPEIDLIAAFEARCEARAQLWSVGEIVDLDEAVDVLQDSAEKTGLVAAIGQDEVQAIMTKAFRPVREAEWTAERAAPIKIDVVQPQIKTAAAPRFHNPSAVKLRLRKLWLTAMAARDKGDHTDLRRQFIEYARTSGLIADIGRHGEEDVRHVVDWGLRGMNPWGTGEFPND
jgi:hypothetical protein